MQFYYWAAVYYIQSHSFHCSWCFLASMTDLGSAVAVEQAVSGISVTSVSHNMLPQSDCTDHIFQAKSCLCASLYFSPISNLTWTLKFNFVWSFTCLLKTKKHHNSVIFLVALFCLSVCFQDTTKPTGPNWPEVTPEVVSTCDLFGTKWPEWPKSHTWHTDTKSTESWNMSSHKKNEIDLRHLLLGNMCNRKFSCVGGGCHSLSAFF